jgi:hypothetical protein
MVLTGNMKWTVCGLWPIRECGVSVGVGVGGCKCVLCYPGVVCVRAHVCARASLSCEGCITVSLL